MTDDDQSLHVMTLTSQAVYFSHFLLLSAAAVDCNSYTVARLLASVILSQP